MGDDVEEVIVWEDKFSCTALSSMHVRVMVIISVYEVQLNLFPPAFSLLCSVNCIETFCLAIFTNHLIKCISVRCLLNG